MNCGGSLAKFFTLIETLDGSHRGIEEPTENLLREGERFRTGEFSSR
jgi:hypothetical protein